MSHEIDKKIEDSIMLELIGDYLSTDFPIL